eukprot:g3918.t1
MDSPSSSSGHKKRRAIIAFGDRQELMKVERTIQDFFDTVRNVQHSNEILKGNDKGESLQSVLDFDCLFIDDTLPGHTLQQIIPLVLNENPNMLIYVHTAKANDSEYIESIESLGIEDLIQKPTSRPYMKVKLRQCMKNIKTLERLRKNESNLNLQNIAIEELMTDQQLKKTPTTAASRLTQQVKTVGRINSFTGGRLYKRSRNTSLTGSPGSPSRPSSGHRRTRAGSDFKNSKVVAHATTTTKDEMSFLASYKKFMKEREKNIRDEVEERVRSKDNELDKWKRKSAALAFKLGLLERKKREMETERRRQSITENEAKQINLQLASVEELIESTEKAITDSSTKGEKYNHIFETLSKLYGSCSQYEEASALLDIATKRRLDSDTKSWLSATFTECGAAQPAELLIKRSPRTQRVTTGKLDKAKTAAMEQQWLNADWNVWQHSEGATVEATLEVFKDLGLVNGYPYVKSTTLSRFVVDVSKHYRMNPFHNFMHAYDTLHTAKEILNIFELRQFFVPLDILALATAALVHDVGHPGTNNTYQILKQTTLALQYNDQSVLENYHCTLAFQIMSKDGNDVGSFFLKDEEKTQFRAIVIASILSTDVGKNMTMIERIEHSHYTDPSELPAQVKVTLVLVASDLSNQVKPFEIGKKWARLCQEEFQLQGELETSEKFCSGPMCLPLDSGGFTLPQFTTNFIDFVCAPLYTLFMNLFPDNHLSILVKHLLKNREIWEKEWHPEDEPGQRNKKKKKEKREYEPAQLIKIRKKKKKGKSRGALRDIKKQKMLLNVYGSSSQGSSGRSLSPSPRTTRGRARNRADQQPTSVEKQPTAKLKITVKSNHSEGKSQESSPATALTITKQATITTLTPNTKAGMQRSDSKSNKIVSADKTPTKPTLPRMNSNPRSSWNKVRRASRMITRISSFYTHIEQMSKSEVLFDRLSNGLLNESDFYEKFKGLKAKEHREWFATLARKVKNLGLLHKMTTTVLTAGLDLTTVTKNLIGFISQALECDLTYIVKHENEIQYRGAQSEKLISLVKDCLATRNAKNVTNLSKYECEHSGNRKGSHDLSNEAKAIETKDIDDLTHYISALCVPILDHDGECRDGVITCLRTEKTTSVFKRQELSFLTKIAFQAGIVLRNARNHHTTLTMKKENEMMLQHARALLTHGDDSASLLPDILRRMGEHIEANSWRLYTLDEDTSSLSCVVVGQKSMSGGIEGRTLPIKVESGIALAIAKNGQVVNVKDVKMHSSYNDFMDRYLGYDTVSFLGVPLHASGQMIGVCTMLNKSLTRERRTMIGGTGGSIQNGIGGDSMKAQFTGKDEEILQSLCSQLSMALFNSRNSRKLVNERHQFKCVLGSITDLVFSLDQEEKLLLTNNIGVLEEWLVCKERYMRTHPYTQWLSEINEQLAFDISTVYLNGKAIEVKNYEFMKHSEFGGEPISAGIVNYSISALQEKTEEDRDNDSTNGNLDGKSHRAVKGVVVSIQDISATSQLIKKMGAYVNPEIVEKLVGDEKLSLGGIRQNAVCLFADIRSFTSISEEMDPGDVVEMLNDYFSFMYPAIDCNRGIIDKYIGDCIFAVFGIPNFVREETSLDACKAAIAMRYALQKFNTAQILKGARTIKVGIGLNTGAVISGNIGSIKRLEYTCIGDGVNLASRLEGLTKIYGCEILISEFTYAEVKPYVIVREIDSIRVVGKKKAVKIYQLVSLIQTPIENSEGSGKDGTMAESKKHFISNKGLRSELSDERRGSAIPKYLSGKEPRRGSHLTTAVMPIMDAITKGRLFFQLPRSIAPSFDCFNRLNEVFQEGLHLYREQKFEEAYEKFYNANNIIKDPNGNDTMEDGEVKEEAKNREEKNYNGPVDLPSVLFMNRCKYFIERGGAPEGWDGVWTFTTK